MPVKFETEGYFKEIDRKTKGMIRGAVRAAMNLVGFYKDFELFIIFTGNDEIRAINKEHRQMDKATDVLSFPMADINKGVITSDVGDYDPESGRIMLGDVVISVEKAREQARDYGHGFIREIVFLAIHGLLHVLGFDHGSEEDEDEMLKIKYKVLKEMGLDRDD